MRRRDRLKGAFNQGVPKQRASETMGLSDELRSGVGPWWERVVNHRFVMELGDNTLDPQVFQTYFDQDFLFLKDWAILLSLASAKAPDFEACRQVVGFLHLGLGGEESLFQEAFRQRGMSAQDVANLAYRPTTLHYSGYLRNIAYSGDFTDIVATLLAVEWPYLDWAQRLEKAGKQPANHFYQTWIDLHTSPGMAAFVGWLRSVIDEAELTAAARSWLQRIFVDVLRYEHLFWEMAYEDDRWPE